jgi:hypothetical protein
MTVLLRFSKMSEGLSLFGARLRALFVLMTQCRLLPLGVDVVGHGLLPDR